MSRLNGQASGGRRMDSWRTDSEAPASLNRETSGRTSLTWTDSNDLFTPRKSLGPTPGQDIPRSMPANRHPLPTPVNVRSEFVKSQYTAYPAVEAAVKAGEATITFRPNSDTLQPKVARYDLMQSLETEDEEPRLNGSKRSMHTPKPITIPRQHSLLEDKPDKPSSSKGKKSNISPAWKLNHLQVRWP
jgi:hypothetical protein